MVGNENSGDKVGHPYYGNQHGPGRAIKTSKGKTPGCKQWSGKINKQFAKKVEFTNKTPQEIKDDVYKQMSELTEITGIQPEHYIVYTRDESSFGRYASLGETATWDSSNRYLGMADHATKEWIKNNIPIKYEENKKNLTEQVEKARSEGNYSYARDLQEKLDNLEERAGYEGKTYVGNGKRNPIIDHEFFHEMTIQRMHPKEKPDKVPTNVREMSTITSKLRDKLSNCSLDCRVFMQKVKVSHYGAERTSNAEIPWEEASAETYAYWKAGNEIPKSIETIFLSLESGDIYSEVFK